MRTFLSFLICLAIVSCDNKTNTLYKDKLFAVKKNYPFDKWKTYPAHGLIQYTPANCDNIKKIFDDLIDELVSLGENASEPDKVSAFKKAIEKTNVLNNTLHGTLIETGEREELCDLTDSISIACNIDSEKYGAGEGLASEWRDW